MRFLLGLILLVLVAAGLYAGYWFFAAERIRAETDDWAEAREAEGWEVSRIGLAVEGFPGPHTIVMSGLDVAAPPAQGGWEFLADELVIAAAAPWDFTEWTVRPQSAVRIALADGEMVDLAATQSSLLLDTDGGIVRHFYAEATDVAIGAATAPLRAAESVFAQGDLENGVWRVQFESRGAQIAEGAFGDARDAFGGEIQVLALDLLAQEEGLAVLAAGGAGLEDAGDLTISAAHLEWGAAELSGEGALGVDADGRLRGTFDVAVADAASFLGALAGSGVLDPRQANVALAASTFFPRDDQDRMILPFTFRGGDTRLGPVAIGPAPVVYEAR